MTNVTREHAEKIVDLLKHGLVSGLGVQEPGKMCVEAAVCFALGLPHGDNPPCVGEGVRRFKIALNDKDWSSNQARAEGMRRLAIAQLGSNEIDQEKFRLALQRNVIQRVLPVAFRAVAGMKKHEKHRDEMLRVALLCETTPTRESALEAKRVMNAAAAAAAAYAAYAAAAYAAYAAAAYAAYAAAAYAAYAAAAYAAAYAVKRDSIYNLAAECGVDALKECGSKGCEWLDLCEVSA